MSSKSKIEPAAKPSALKWLETVLLIVVLGLTALRATYIENPQVEQPGSWGYDSLLVSLTLSSLLIGCCMVWLLASLLAGYLHWRKTWLGAAMGLFIVAGVVSFWAASDKRAAAVDTVLLGAPMLTALLLIQLLDSARKCRFALLLIVSIGAAGVGQCIEQMTESNDVMIAEYERDPMPQLDAQGIEPDSLQHWMYEHRLYSKDIRGFLMTSNSTASFFLLAGFAALGLCLEALTQRKHTETLAALLCYGLALVAVVAGLVMTKSKGGNGALIIGLLLLAVISLFGKRLWKYRLAVGIVLLIAIVAGAGLIIGYGVQNGRLPGGNSMLVRWQYWQSTAEMVADHGLTGVGGGNFADYYTHYKNAAASETIQNPHCWVLSLLSQYGPLGLAAFVLAIGIVCFKGLQSRFETIDEAAAIQPTGDKKFWVPIAVTTVVLMLTARPILMGANLAGQASGVWIAAYTVLYITPAGAFLLAFGLLSLAAGGDLSIDKRNSHLTIALICGLIAVLVHNLIDFAIFEPGVWSVVWLFAAVLIAGVHHRSRQPARVIRLGSGGRLLGCFGLIATAIIYGAVIVAPPVKATATLKKLPMSEGVDNLMTGIETAVSADPLSSNIPYKTARLLMQIGLTENPLSKDTAVFETALKLAQESQRRNPAGFKPCRLQSDIALMLAERSEDEQVPDCLENAYAALANAAERYPGSDDIQYKLGMVAEQRGAYAAALGHFKKALEFEMAYQAQFRVMYPDREPVVSRLGNTATTITRAKIEELTKKLGESASP